MKLERTISEYTSEPFSEVQLNDLGQGKSSRVRFARALVVLLGFSGGVNSLVLSFVGAKYDFLFLQFGGLFGFCASIFLTMMTYVYLIEMRRTHLKITELEHWACFEKALQKSEVSEDLLVSAKSREFFTKIQSMGRKPRKFELDIIEYINDVESPGWRKQV